MLFNAVDKVLEAGSSIATSTFEDINPVVSQTSLLRSGQCSREEIRLGKNIFWLRGAQGMGELIGRRVC